MEDEEERGERHAGRGRVEKDGGKRMNVFMETMCENRGRVTGWATGLRMGGGDSAWIGNARLMCVCVFAGEGLRQVHQQDLPPADLPPDPPLQVEQAERAQEEVPGLVSVRPPPHPPSCADLLGWK